MGKKWLWVAFGAVAIIVLIVYSFVDPEKSVWMPKCPFHLLTGYDCPACGNGRALYHLLHGEFLEAVRFNPFLCVSMPYLIVLVLSPFFPKWLDPLGRLARSRGVVLTYVVLICIWWVFRNTNFYHGLVGIEPHVLV